MATDVQAAPLPPTPAEADPVVATSPTNLGRRPSWAPITNALGRIKSISIPAIPTNIRRPSFTRKSRPADIAAPAAEPSPAPPAEPKGDFEWFSKQPGQKRSDKRAERAALALRSWTFEIGSPPATASISKALSQLKSDLLNPTIGNKIILQLKTLSALYGPSATPPPTTPAPHQHIGFPPTAGPIHAVCLDCTDEEANDKIFNRLPRSSKLRTQAQAQAKASGSADTTGTVPSVQNADLNSVVSVLSDIKLVNLIERPESRVQSLGLGEMLGGGGPGKDQMADGLMHMGEQLMALGFATSYAVFPDHSGVYPPTDRMSIITYWWGFEVVIPPQSIKHLNEVVSISHAVLNFLTAIALVNAGVREIQPFIRYVAQYIDFQWASIKEKDKGEGVVCAAVWVLPLALVTRAWDFPPRPPPKDDPKEKNGEGKPAPPKDEKKPEPVSEIPVDVEKPVEEKPADGEVKIFTAEGSAEKS